MKNYLSFGGGVNSVALHLMLLDQGVDFESIFVHHGSDWPETYIYVAGFQWWLKANGHRPITILRPNVEGYDNLYDYCWHYEMVPFFSMRFCTAKFKVRVIQKYVKTPCFQYLGISTEESHRAKVGSFKGSENRFPLIEHGVDREGCKQIIADHGLPIPMKSGCWFCMFQKKSEWKKLRMDHPDLFCKAKQLEDRNNEYRRRNGKAFMGLTGKKDLMTFVNESQQYLFEKMGYPPCQCGL